MMTPSSLQGRVVGAMARCSAVAVPSSTALEANPEYLGRWALSVTEGGGRLCFVLVEVRGGARPSNAGGMFSVRSHGPISCENSPIFFALGSCLTQPVGGAGSRLSPEQVTHW